MADDEMERQEIAAMLQQANEVTDESLASTRRMKNYAEQSRKVGAETLVTLDQQGEQLNRVDGDLDQINQNMRAAEAELTQMEKCCGCCTCPWNRRKNIEDSKKYRKAYGPERGQAANGVVNEQPAGQPPLANPSTAETGENGKVNYIKRITNDEREEEMNENVGAVHEILGDLKAQAKDMGTELDRQNHQIDKINKKTEVSGARVQNANVRANVLLRG
eukprot:Clim_evm8s167 gene=Clim_evmTU8s167